MFYKIIIKRFFFSKENRLRKECHSIDVEFFLLFFVTLQKYFNILFMQYGKGDVLLGLTLKTVQSMSFSCTHISYFYENIIYVLISNFKINCHSIVCYFVI